MKVEARIDRDAAQQGLANFDNNIQALQATDSLCYMFLFGFCFVFNPLKVLKEKKKERKPS